MGFDGAALAVVPLDAEHAKNTAATGAKAANPARAAVAGLPVLPGFVLMPAGRAPWAPVGEDAVRSAWRALAGPQERALVVRSSSAHEDTEESSMAGRFESVLDVRGWEEFTKAVQIVLDSAGRVRPLRPPQEIPDGDGMAVLVQPMLESTVGGVMFGADPVEGRTDRILVSAVAGGPHQLVDGSTQDVRYQLTRLARLVRTDPAEARGHRRPGRRTDTTPELNICQREHEVRRAAAVAAEGGRPDHAGDGDAHAQRHGRLGADAGISAVVAREADASELPQPTRVRPRPHHRCTDSVR
ncbi:PEP/pyruvate-binding domain-containing protein [Streptomyces sp. WM6386]|uniref:PEP/pyruvate-binding domain-containing protein n=1 Tax=Streptomyces sp. WM6386 TaxID=1415558 RepID=UPI000619E56B|nr:PEP/pyruvate-binding domain-containing protein [Streptomyces sp. WM6386]KKD09202.1 hypothetical protein TN53_03595 [Streptomyces sp. WM6386]